MSETRIFKYKLDYYYKSLFIYLITFIVYVIIRGKFFQEKFEIVIKDPIIYVFALFIIFFLIVLLSNFIRGREIIFSEDKIIFKNSFGQREIALDEILQVRFKIRKYRRNIEERAKIVKLKLKNRKRYLRIRLNDFEKEAELIKEFRKISKQNLK